MQTIKTVETQVPFLKESFFTSTFRGRRKSSVSNLLRRQQHSALLLTSAQQQQQLIPEHDAERQPTPAGQGGAGPPQHPPLARSTSSPLCKTADRAKREGRRESRDERERGAKPGRGGDVAWSGSEPMTVSASLHLPSAPAEAAVATASAASIALPPVVVRRRSFIRRGSTLVAAPAQEGVDSAQARAQQHGLIAKGVRLLRNMGNQEAKQKKAGGGGGPGDGDPGCDEAEGADKKSRKLPSKVGKGSGAENGSKKKESKGSVFSGMRIRKSLSKAKGLSKEDILDIQRSAAVEKTDLCANADGSVSTDDMGMMSDSDSLTGDGKCSMVDEGQRRMSMASDADLYSFHSAVAEREDLLSDIQLTIRQQHHGVTEGLDMCVPTASSQSEVMSLALPNPRVEAEPSATLHHTKAEHQVVTQTPTERPSLSRDSSEPGLLSERSPSSSPAVERNSGGLFQKTNSTLSFRDSTANTSYESAEGSQDNSPVSPAPGDIASQGEDVCFPAILVAPSTGAPMGPLKRVSSLHLSLDREEDDGGRRDFLSLNRRQSNLSMSPGSPPASGQRRKSSVASTVKLYPPIHPSYVKTTTRQLTSPVSSPITSPQVPRRTDDDAHHDAASGLEPSLAKAQGLKVRRQRSCSVAGPLAISTDWSRDVDEMRPGHDGDDGSPKINHSGGAYWTLGSKRGHARHKSSSSAVSCLDVFSGESSSSSSLTCSIGY